jgi:thymidylate synthase (FAD)
MELHKQPDNNVYFQQDDEQRQALDVLQDGISSIELIRASGSDLDVVNAARVSYGKVSTQLSERDKKLINFLMKYDHTSPFEHNQLSFRVKAPMYVVRQWMRHRISSYNEISYRYVKAPLEFYTPRYWRYQDTQNRQGSVGRFDDKQLLDEYTKTLNITRETYERMLENGVAREQARGILPVCTYTEFIYTCNLLSLSHFLKLRIKEDAQYEIRQYAKGLLKLALPHFPASLEAWKKKNNIDDEIFDSILKTGHNDNK